jgi:hypothetical protein
MRRPFRSRDDGLSGYLTPISQLLDSASPSSQGSQCRQTALASPPTWGIGAGLRSRALKGILAFVSQVDRLYNGYEMSRIYMFDGTDDEALTSYSIGDPDDVRFCNGTNHRWEAPMRAGSSAASVLRAPQKARVGRRVFSLDKRLTWRSATRRKLGELLGK